MSLASLAKEVRRLIDEGRQADKPLKDAIAIIEDEQNQSAIEWESLTLEFRDRANQLHEQQQQRLLRRLEDVVQP